MLEPLAGKVALVTGASRGIGAAIAVRLATAGADVAITYRSQPDRAAETVKAIETLGRRALSFYADQADPADAQALVRSVVDGLGRLDILVNSAGILVTTPIDANGADDAQLQRQIAVNMQGVRNTVKAATSFLPRGGRIITVGTAGGAIARVGFPGMADYFATKSALAAYTKGWARDLGPRDITVNIVQPGPIDTDMNPATGDFAPMMAGATALGHYGTAEDIAAAVGFLASPEARFITGAALDVDGGLSA